LHRGQPNGIDAALQEPLQLTAATRVVLIGRVGPMSQPRPVLWAAFDRGWYAMWWPGVDPTQSVAVTNRRNEVLASVVPLFP
jgi:hypothetical protein